MDGSAQASTRHPRHERSKVGHRLAGIRVDRRERDTRMGPVFSFEGGPCFSYGQTLSAIRLFDRHLERALELKRVCRGSQVKGPARALASLCRSGGAQRQPLRSDFTPGNASPRAPTCAGACSIPVRHPLSVRTRAAAPHAHTTSRKRPFPIELSTAYGPARRGYTDSVNLWVAFRFQSSARLAELGHPKAFLARILRGVPRLDVDSRVAKSRPRCLRGAQPNALGPGLDGLTGCPRSLPRRSFSYQVQPMRVALFGQGKSGSLDHPSPSAPTSLS